MFQSGAFLCVSLLDLQLAIVGGVCSPTRILLCGRDDTSHRGCRVVTTYQIGSNEDAGLLGFGRRLLFNRQLHHDRLGLLLILDYCRQT